MYMHRTSAVIFVLLFLIGATYFKKESLRTSYYQYYHQLHYGVLDPYVSQQQGLSSTNYAELQQLCSKTTFTPGLWLHCHSFGGEHRNANNGGLSNARNRYQSCLRLAIDAGMGVIMAPLMQRDNNNVGDTNHNEVCPETILDVADLAERMAEVCPAMPIRGCNDASGIDITLRAQEKHHLSGGFVTGKFKAFIDDTIAESGVVAKEDISNEKAVKVEFGDSFMGWNYTATSEQEMKRELFNIVNFNTTLLDLGTKVYNAIKKKANGKPIVGVHFRGESDWPEDVCSAETQIKFYTEELEKWNNLRGGIIEDVYVSCGDMGRIQLFREALAPLGYAVHDKDSLLTDQPQTRQTIDDLNFDQKAVVEYVPLQSATYFLGLLPSTLSYIAAYSRTAATDHEQAEWFETHLLFDSTRGHQLQKFMPKPLEMKGDDYTKLLVIDKMSELSDAFP
jgi:hypothetical protein